MFEKFINMTTHDDDIKIRDSIIYTLVTLISTRAPFKKPIMAGHPDSGHRQTGLRGFGIPCCQTHLNDQSRLRQTLEQKILLYEPRLNRVTVYMDYGQNTLSFFIEGSISGTDQQSIQLRISYPCHLQIT
ncbi:GPW/gp25 family protein [Endozoicomonas sp.]|uniref:GPW/gp25 family protein n=1 Tax=Endozoicomonas sp. TaxID=1892382 RepID=UPI00288881C1|nr:GPW/gp25 family protein [Endozoicomonas sp.]